MADATPRWRLTAPWLAASLFYVAFTLIQTWPLTRHLSDVVPNDLGDPLLNTWIIWWNAHAVPLTTRWWNAPSFWPSTGALAFSELLLGLVPITTPIQWLGGSPIAAYNVVFLLTFPLSAIAAHALVFRLTGRHDAGVIAGLVFGFNPFRVAHFPQIQVMTSCWMPVALLGLHEYVGSRKARWLGVFAVAWLMQALSNGYYLLFFPVLVGIWMVWFTLSRSTWRTFTAIATAFIAGSLPLIPLLWTYRRIHSAFGFQRNLGEVSGFGADVVSLLDASPLLKFWHLHSFHQSEGELFPGFTAATLIFLLGVHWLWTLQRITKVPRGAFALLAGAFLFGGVGLSALMFGPWSIQIGKMTLLSVREISKPLSVSAILLLAGLARLPTISDGWRRRSPLMFYVLATGLMYLLCFGPQPRFLGTAFLYRGPYRLLMALPGYDAVRAPARFAMLAALCVSVAAALAFVRMSARAGRLPRFALAAIIVCGVIVDSAIGDMPLKPLPPRLRSFESLPLGAAVMELPLGDSEGDVVAMYRGMYHQHPVVNGYSGFFPTSYGVLRRGLDAQDPVMFDAITAWGPVVVMVNTFRDARGAWVKQLEQRENTRFLGEESGWKVFSLAGEVVPSDVTSTEQLPIEAVSANVNADRVALAIDGNMETRWDSGPQQGTEVVTIELDGDRNVDGITMMIAGHPADFPRRLVIETSDDKREWTTRWEGTSAVAAFIGAVRHPREMPLMFALPHVPARWLRLRQVGHDPVFYWSIFELRVIGT